MRFPCLIQSRKKTRTGTRSRSCLYAMQHQGALYPVAVAAVVGDPVAAAVALGSTTGATSMMVLRLHAGGR